MAVAAMGMMAQAQPAEKPEAKQQSATYDDGITKKWELRLDVGPEAAFVVDDNDFKLESGAVLDIGGGYNFNSNWYLGLSSGFFFRTGRSKEIEAPNYIPLLADVTYRYSLDTEDKWAIFLEGRGGYLFVCNGDYQLPGNVMYEYKNSLYFDLQPGICFRPRPNIDVKLSVGYSYYKTGSDEDVYDAVRNTSAMVVKLGVNYRGKAKKAARR